METKKVFVDIDGQSKSLTICERTGRQAITMRKLAAKGTQLDKAGNVIGLDGEAGITYMEEELKTGIKTFPDGIKDFNELMNKISSKDMDSILQEIRELNGTGDLEKK